MTTQTSATSLPSSGLPTSVDHLVVGAGFAGLGAAIDLAATPDLVTAAALFDLVSKAWLDGFVPWAHVAHSLGRPVPDLVGFYAQ